VSEAPAEAVNQVKARVAAVAKATLFQPAGVRLPE
jgi:hypothetical protein